jgi:ring-1,2-phenylacetyl-CoA epoxidase subunit PaaE
MQSPSACSLLNGGRNINMVLTVSDIEQQGTDAVSVEFALPEGEKLSYLAGQYITVGKWLKGEHRTRCYSLCAGPDRGILKIGVRKTSDGLMSRYINEKLKVGDNLIVQGPFGDFVYPNPTSQHRQAKRLSCVAGGSGITPILSIIEPALQAQSGVNINLIYACRCRNSIMFYNTIETLKAQYPQRFSVRYVIKHDTQQSLDTVGRVNRVLLQSELSVLNNRLDSSELDRTDFYVCGPNGLKSLVVDTLTDFEVNDANIYVEEFVSSATAPVGKLHQVDIEFTDGSKHVLSVASNQTVLEVATASGIQLPHACGTGTCGTCKFNVRSGTTAPIPDFVSGITIEEKQSAATLACKCNPLQDIKLVQP